MIASLLKQMLPFGQNIEPALYKNKPDISRSLNNKPRLDFLGDSYNKTN